MHPVKAFMMSAVLLSFSTVTNAASGLPGETSPGISGQSSTEQPGQSGDKQGVEKQRRDQGIGTSGDLPMQDKGMRPQNPPADPSKSGRVKDEQIMMGSSIPMVKGEVLRVEGDKYTVKDQAGTEVSLMVNQNTRMDCGAGSGSISGFQPQQQTATDRPLGQGDQQAQGLQKQGQEGKLQDLSRTNEQPGTEVGKAIKPGESPDLSASSSSQGAACAFKAGDKIEAEVSDMGAATMIKKVSDKSKGSDDKGMGGQQPQGRQR